MPSYRDNLPVATLTWRSRRLRRDSTDAERLIWRHLRDRQLGGAKFLRQHQFGPYVLDFYCADHRLAIEAGGDQHYSDRGAARDAARTRYLEAGGVRVMRFTNLEILQETEAVIEAIRRAMEVPSPSEARLR